MKRMTTVRLLAGSVIFVTGAVAPNASAQPHVLGREMFVQMDANRDRRVSMSEYLDYGTAYLKQKGKDIDPDAMEKKFLNFDRDGDGYITGKESAGGRPEKTGEAGGRPRGHIMANAKVKKNHERTVDRAEKIRPGGTLVTTTTKRIKEETQSLTIAVSNGGSEQDKFELCWYFFCRAQDDEVVRVYDEGSEHITLGPRQCITHNVVARTISTVEQSVQQQNEDTGLCSKPMKSRGGDRVEGFLVLLKYGDIVLDKVSNSRVFMEGSWLSKL